MVRQRAGRTATSATSKSRNEERGNLLQIHNSFDRLKQVETSSIDKEAERDRTGPWNKGSGKENESPIT